MNTTEPDNGTYTNNNDTDTNLNTNSNTTSGSSSEGSTTSGSSSGESNTGSNNTTSGTKSSPSGTNTITGTGSKGNNTLPTISPQEEEVLSLLKNDPCFNLKDCTSCVSLSDSIECVWCPSAVVISCQTGTITGADNLSLCGSDWYWTVCLVTGDSAGIDQSYIIYIVCFFVAILLIGCIIFVIISTCTEKGLINKKIKRLKTVQKMNNVVKDDVSSISPDSEDGEKLKEEEKDSEKSNTYSSLA